MVKQPNVEYIRLYTNGSAALKLEPAVKTVNTPKKAPRKHKRKNIYIDPVAILSIAVAVLMLVTVITGFVRLQEARDEVTVMEEYVDRLQADNTRLTHQYKIGYNPEEVRRTALALNMIPAEQAAHISIEIPPETEQVTQLTLWERIGTFLTGLFA